MKIKSRLIGALVCLAMLVSLLQLSVLAADIEVNFEIPEGSEADVADGTVISAEEVMTGFSDGVRGNIETLVGKDAEIIVAYDISLTLDGAEVQPGGKIRVTVPAAIENSKYDAIKVVYIDSDGKVILCDAMVNSDGTVSFLAESLGRYAIVGVPKSGPSIAVIVVLIAAIGVIGSSLLFRKKKGDEAPTPEGETAEGGEAVETTEEAEEAEEAVEGEEPEETENDAE